MPPKVTLEQAAHFARALARGEPNAVKIALTVLSDKVRELLSARLMQFWLAAAGVAWGLLTLP
jgi:hypothetical protein